jgi:hypothetical protein
VQHLLLASLKLRMQQYKRRALITLLPSRQLHPTRTGQILGRATMILLISSVILALESKEVLILLQPIYQLELTTSLQHSAAQKAPLLRERVESYCSLIMVLILIDRMLKFCKHAYTADHLQLLGTNIPARKV